MKTKNVALKLTGLLAALTILLAACGAPTPAPTQAPTQPPAATEAPTTAPTEAPAEPVTIKYWHTHSDPESAKLDEVIAAFEAANPGIKVEATRYAYNDFKTALLTAVSGGDVPDVVRMDIVWVPEFANQGALMQMD